MGGRPKQRWSELSPRARTAIVALGAAELVCTAIALVDFARRPSELVRGRKRMWFPVLFLQPLGSPLYLLVGRRRDR